MASTSTVVIAKNALITQLQASSVLAGVQITYNPPNAEQLRKDAIFLGDVRGTMSYPVLVAGRKPRQETYTIDLFVSAVTPGQPDASAAETRALALRAAVEDIVADDPTLGRDDLQQVGIVDFDMNSGPADPGGFACLIRLSIDVSARLS